MIAAVSSLSRTLATTYHRAADATTLIAQEALAGAQAAAQSASLAGRAVTKAVSDLWEGSDWVQLDSFNELLFRHTDGRFLSPSGPLLPRVQSFLEQDILASLVSIRTDIINEIPTAANWSAEEWLGFFQAGGPNSITFAWNEQRLMDLVAYEQLADAFAGCQLTLAESEAWVALAESSFFDLVSYSTAEVAQISPGLMYPPSGLGEAALARFPGHLNELKFTGLNGQTVTYQQLLEGPIYPNAAKLKQLCMLPEDDLVEIAQGVTMMGCSEAERAQFFLVLDPGLRELPASATPPLFADATGRLLTIEELSMPSDMSKFAELDRLSMHPGFDWDCQAAFDRSDFAQIIDQLKDDYPHLDAWFDGLEYEEFLDAFNWNPPTEKTAQALILLETGPIMRAVSCLRTLSPADQVRWLVIHEDFPL